MVRFRGVVISACVLFGVASGCSPATPKTADATTVVFVGDSLAEQAAPYLGPLLGARTLVPKFLGGTAPCDWLSNAMQITADTIVVISFTGNSLSPCMADGAGGFLLGQAIVDKYRVDITALIDNARSVNAQVLLVGQPVRGDPLPADDVIAGLNAVYVDLAISDGVEFVDAGAAVENPDGSFAHALPCLADEAECDPSGSNVVRSDDGLHFCPGLPTGPCAVYASGAFRFATVIADAIINS
jgi:hypothetical protein